MVRVMIVDQGEYFRLGIGQTLASERDIEVVGDFGRVEEAIAQREELNPHVVLISVSLPGVSGFQACERVMAQLPAARAIMMSWEWTDAEEASAVCAGAAAYLSKDVAPWDLVQAVRGDGQE